MDEAALVEAIRERADPDAFRLLIESHAPRVHRIVAAVLGPFRDLDAEDVAQEVFLKAFANIGQFRSETPFAGWLNTIAYRAAAEARRAGRIRYPHDELVDRGSDASPDERMIVAAAMEALPDLYRSVVSMHYWMGFTVDEIATIIDAPAGTVKSYLSRARDRMRKELER